MSVSFEKSLQYLTEQQQSLQALTLERCADILDQAKSLLTLTIQQSNKLHADFAKNVAELKREREDPPELEDPINFDDDEEEEEESSFDGSVDLTPANDVNLNLVAFVKLYKSSNDFQKAAKASPWARKHFLAPLEGVRNNLGRGEACVKEKFDELFVIYDYTTEVSWNEDEVEGPTKCILCNCKKNCQHTLYVNGEPFPIADNCAHLADAVIQFVTRLNELAKGESKDVNSLDILFTQILQGHADKKKKRRR